VRRSDGDGDSGDDACRWEVLLSRSSHMLTLPYLSILALCYTSRGGLIGREWESRKGAKEG